MARVLNILYTTIKIQEENSRVFVILPKDFLDKENDWLKIAELNFIKIKYISFWKTPVETIKRWAIYYVKILIEINVCKYFYLVLIYIQNKSI